MKTSEIIDQLLKQTGLKQEELAEQIGSYQAQISRWKKGARLTDDAIRERLHALARKYGILPDPNAQPQRSAKPSEFISVPILSDVSAGKLTTADSQIPVGEHRTISLAGLGAGEFFALEVKGNSMDRISPEGSIIVVNKRQRTLQDGKPYVFAVRGEVTYKLWKASPARLQPYSTDPENEPIFIDKRNSLVIIGRVRRSIYDL